MYKKLLSAMAVFAFAVSGQVSFAQTTYSYSFGTEFSGGTNPAGPSPWATLTFSDISGGVLMTLSLSNITASEKVSNFYFNFGPNPGLGDPALEARFANLTFAHTGGDASSGILRGLDSHKADGDGHFDINFGFPTSNNTFGAGEQSIYTITGGLVTAADFDYLSQCANGCGNGGWNSALHVQSIGAEGKSGWIGATVSPVPEPESYAMMLAGLGLVSFIARRRLRRV